MDERLTAALRRIDEENSRDPHSDVVDGQSVPRELLYARRVSEWVERLCPEASDALRLAARGQHICRWEIPRATYEMTRAGYLRWRADLKEFHAGKMGEILRAVGYDDAFIARVQDLNRKKNLGRDADCQTLEDALCLVTLQFQLADLVARTAPETMDRILQKTWKKMSPAAQQAALGLSYTEPEKAALARAFGSV